MFYFPLNEILINFLVARVTLLVVMETIVVKRLTKEKIYKLKWGELVKSRKPRLPCSLETEVRGVECHYGNTFHSHKKRSADSPPSLPPPAPLLSTIVGPWVAHILLA